LSDDQIKKGLNKVCDNGSAFVPTAPEFKKLCIGGDEHWEHKVQKLAFQEAAKRLEAPKPEINKKIGSEFLKRWKENAAR